MTVIDRQRLRKLADQRDADAVAMLFNDAVRRADWTLGEHLVDHLPSDFVHPSLTYRGDLRIDDAPMPPSLRLIQTVEGDLVVSAASLTRWPLPQLRRVSGKIRVTGCDRLVHLDISALVASAAVQIEVFNNRALQTIDLGALTEASDLRFDTLPALERISAPTLDCLDALNIEDCERLHLLDCPRLRSVNQLSIVDSGDGLVCRLPKLEFVVIHLELTNADIARLDFTALDAVMGSAFIEACRIETLYVPVLTGIYGGGLRIEGCEGLRTLTCPSLTTIGDVQSMGSRWSGLPVLERISLPALTTVVNDLHIYDAPALVAVDAPMLREGELHLWCDPDEDVVASDAPMDVDLSPSGDSAAAPARPVASPPTPSVASSPEPAPTGCGILVAYVFCGCLVFWLYVLLVTSGGSSASGAGIPPHVSPQYLASLEVSSVHMVSLRRQSDRRITSLLRLRVSMTPVGRGPQGYCERLQRRFKVNVLGGRVVNPKPQPGHHARCVAGDLIIHHVDDTTLARLRGVVAVEGDLVIENNAALEHLHGLESLALVGGRVRLDDNPKLRTLAGLGPLEYLGGKLVHDLPYASVP